MGVKNTGIQVIAVFVTRTKLSKTGPKSPVIMVPWPKTLWGISVRGDHNHADQIICDSTLNSCGTVAGRYLGGTGMVSFPLHVVVPWAREKPAFCFTCAGSVCFFFLIAGFLSADHFASTSLFLIIRVVCQFIHRVLWQHRLAQLRVVGNTN